VVERFVPGIPAPQGSKRFLGVKGGRGVMVESASEKVRSWRADVREAFAGVLSDPLVGPVRVEVEFRLPRPASVPPRRRPWPTVKPDVDKLVRSTLDALKSAGVYGDDAQVVRLVAAKVYADEGPPGAVIGITLFG
jgi:Holliday junction resolvase RusA-like endonuclease